MMQPCAWSTKHNTTGSRCRQRWELIPANRSRFQSHDVCPPILAFVASDAAGAGLASWAAGKAGGIALFVRTIGSQFFGKSQIQGRTNPVRSPMAECRFPDRGACSPAVDAKRNQGDGERS